MNVNTKYENVSLLEKVKFSLIVLLDFFTHYVIGKIIVLRDEQRTRKIQNTMKSTGYLE